MKKIDFTAFLKDLFSFELYHLEIPLIEIYEKGKRKSNKNIEKDVTNYIKENNWDLLATTTDLTQCYRNELTHLPADFEQLKNLKELEYFANLLTDLPKNLVKLKKLKVLNCSYNQLNSFPDELKKIKELDFSHNLLLII